MVWIKALIQTVLEEEEKLECSRQVQSTKHAAQQATWHNICCDINVYYDQG